MLDARKNVLRALGCAAAMAACGASAQEQPTATRPAPAAGLLDEVIVTAQRREEAVQDVPLAVSAFSEAQLEQLNVTETLDLARVVPNLLGHNNTGLGSANVYTMRGLGNTESIATFDPPVGTYVDEVFIARQNANNFALFDVDRIEVLRGPQGTLFGRNTTGGAMNVVLRKPAEEFGGYLDAGFGQYDHYTVRGSVDLPLGERLLTKLSAFYLQDDGFVANPTTGEDDLNGQESWGVRAALRLRAGEAVTWDLSADLVDDDHLSLLNFSANGPERDNAAPGAVERNIAANCRGPITRARFACTGMRQDRSTLVGFLSGDKQFLPLGNEVRSFSATSNLEWQTPLGALNFITGWRDMEQRFAVDFFNSPDPTGGFTIANIGEHDQLSQEIKLTGSIGKNLRHTSGVFYFDEDNHTDFGDIFVLALPTGRLPAVLEDRILDNTTESWALYTHWDLSFANAWTLTLAGRYTTEEKEIDFISNANPRLTRPLATRINSASIAAVPPPAGPIPLTTDTELFTPRVALKWDLGPDVNVFASATRGFKSGGWNARATAPEQIQPFGPEKVWSYELGLRSEWLDRRLRLNLTGFFMDVEDFQLPSAFRTSTGGIVFITRNFADMENKGVEAEFVWAPTEALTLFSFIGLQNAKYRNLDPSIPVQQQQCLADLAAGVSPYATASRCAKGIVDYRGEIAEVVRTPDTFAVGGNYVFRLTDSLTLTPAVNATRFGDHSVGTSGTPVALVDTYTLWGASLSLRNRDAGWSITANCTNCGDEIYVHTTLAELAYIGDPRTWSVNFRYDFGSRR